MQIILVHNRLTQARTLTLTGRHLVAAVAGFVVFVTVFALAFDLLALQSGAILDVPVFRDLARATGRADADRNSLYMRENLNAMAVKLGEMQAQLMRLDALGERVSGLAGLSPQEFNFSEAPPMGGAEPVGARELTLPEFKGALAQLALSVDRRADFLNIAESALMDSKLQSKMMPTVQPVNVAYNASGFGMRIDPITGNIAMHEGIDFDAASGTPIVAAAGGVVIAAEWHHDFGNMIEIDHGNDISTLYAHCSRVYVHVGDIVWRNQHIADVGSTGRATGAHLHFEVHVKGVPQNPVKFLAANGSRIDDSPKLVAPNAGTLQKSSD